MTVQFTERNKVVGVMAPVDNTTNAITCKPVNFDYYNRVAYIVYPGTVGSSTPTLTVYKGTSAADALSSGSALTFTYRIASAGTGPTTGAGSYSVMDGSVATAASLALTSDRLLVIEVLASDCGKAYPWTCVRVSAAGNNDTLAVIAVCFDARYAQDSIVSVSGQPSPI